MKMAFVSVTFSIDCSVTAVLQLALKEERLDCFNLTNPTLFLLKVLCVYDLTLEVHISSMKGTDMVEENKVSIYREKATR